MENLSLRALARQAGVSHNAIYRHFQDKNGLLAALAIHGFGELTRQMQRRMAAFSGAPRTRLYAGAQVYVNFGLQQPHLHRLMFTLHPDESYPDLNIASRKLFDLMVDTIAEGQAQQKITGGETRLLALTYWSAVHGLVELLVTRKIPYLPDREVVVDGLVRGLVEQILLGLRPHGTGERENP